MKNSFGFVTAAVTATLVVGVHGAGAGGNDNDNDDLSAFQQTNLVSNIAGQAVTTDPSLQNPWGVASPPGGPLSHPLAARSASRALWAPRSG